MKVKAVAAPDLDKTVNKVVHHGGRVVRGRGDTQAFLTEGHGRVIDGLDVDVVVAHEVVTQFGGQCCITNLS